MIVEELVTVLGFKTKGVGDIDKARKAYEAFMKSLKSKSVNVTANIGRATGLFSVQGKELVKNKRNVDALARSMDRLGANVRSAALGVAGLAKSYDRVASSADRARAAIARATTAQRSAVRAGGGIVSPGPARRGRGSNLSNSTALVAPQVRRPGTRRRPYGSGVDVNDLGPVAGAVGAYEAAEAYKQAAAFDRRLTLIGQTADATREQIDRLGGGLHELAQQTATPIDKLTGGLEALVAQGRSLKEGLDFLPAVARTAAASGSEVEDIAKTADSVGSNFSLGAKEMQSAFDIMASGGKAGQFELKDMARYLPSLAPAAKAVGYAGQKGLADMVAMLQVLRKGSGSTEEAATSMSNIFQKLESDETVKNFKEMGVDLEAAMKKGRKEGRNLVEVLEEATQKATKGDLSLIPKLFKDSEYARGMRALLTYGGEWQKLSGNLQSNSAGTVMRDLAHLIKDAQANLDRFNNSWQRFTQGMARLSDAGGVSKGIGDSAKEFEQIARAMERINAAYEKGGLKGAFQAILENSKEGQRENRKAQLEERGKEEDKRVAEMEADNKAYREKLEKEGYSPESIAKTMKLRERELEKARRRKGGVEEAKRSPEVAGTTPPSMLQSPTAPIQGQSGPIGQGQGSNFGQAFNEAFPVDTTKNRTMKKAPLPPRRPSELTPTGPIEDILGPVKPQVDTSEIDAAKNKAAEAATTMQSSLGGSYHPQVDVSSITAAIAAAERLRSTLASAGTTVTAAVRTAAASPAGQAVRSAGGGAGRPSSGAGTMTARFQRETSPGVQVAKLGRDIRTARRGGGTTNVGDVNVQVAATNASPRDIGRATSDTLSRRLARSWSVTAPEPSTA